MKEIRILWLYSDMMDLYGDRGNIMALEYQLELLKVPYTVTEKSLTDELSFSEYDLIYIGPGKDKNAVMAATHLRGYGEEIRKAVEEGKVFLITGNAQILFGSEIEDADGTVTPAVGLFDYKAKLTGEVFLDDFTAKPVFNKQTEIYGLINRTSYLIDNIENPLFEVSYSQKDIGKTEGILYKNFFGTWALGPLLAKNPQILLEILQRLLDVKIIGIDDGLQNIALQKTLGEFPQQQ